MGMVVTFIILGVVIIVSFYYCKYVIQTGEEPFHCPDVVDHIMFPMVKEKIIYHDDYNGYHFDKEMAYLSNTTTNNNITQ